MTPAPVFQDTKGYKTTLLVMRHGIAEDRQPDQTDKEDAARTLVKKGEKRVREMGQVLKRLGYQPTHFVSSPRIRAFQTAEVVRDVFPGKRPISRLNSLDIDGSWRELVADLRKFTSPEGPVILATGHEPCCGEYVTEAVMPEHMVFSVKKAGVIILEWKGPIRENGARFVAYLTPRFAR